MRFHMRRLIPVLLLVSVVRVSAARADIVACPGATNERGYKVLLDDFLINTTPGAGETLFMERLRTSIAFSLDRLYADAGFQVRTVRCDKRRPRGGSDFDPQLVGQLNARDVI